MGRGLYTNDRMRASHEQLFEANDLSKGLPASLSLSDIEHQLHRTHATPPETHEAAPLLTAAVRELATSPAVAHPGRSRHVDPERAPDIDAVAVAIEKAAVSLVSHTYALLHDQDLQARDESLRARPTLTALLDGVKWNTLAPAQANDIMRSLCSLDTQLDNMTEGDWLDELPWAVEAITGRVSSSTARRMYEMSSEDGRDSPLKLFFKNAAVDEQRAPYMLRALSIIYEDEGGVIDVPVGEDVAIDRLREYVSEAELALLSIPERPKNPHDQQSVYEYEKRVVAKVKDIWSDHFGLSDGFGIDFWNAVRDQMYTRDDGRDGAEGEPSDLPYYGGESLTCALRRVHEVVKGVGAPVLERLHAELGVVNVDRYEPEDLLNLNKILTKDADYIKHLKAGDVTVLFSDTYGDHNGALSGANEAYRKQSGRTLMFEVAHPATMYRRMVQLKALGVRPSTLVVAAHGTPTLTHFGKGNDRFALSVGRYAPGDRPPSSLVPLGEARIDRLASDEFMRANRGINSPLKQAGRREIIISSCSSDVEFMRGVPSTAEVVARAAGRQDVDVFGASDVMYLQNRAGGVRFAGLVGDVADENAEFTGITTKVTLDGKVGLIDKLRREIRRPALVARFDVPKKLTKFDIKRTRVDRLPIRNSEWSAAS